jgi:hypothetical protein
LSFSFVKRKKDFVQLKLEKKKKKTRIVIKQANSVELEKGTTVIYNTIVGNKQQAVELFFLC